MIPGNNLMKYAVDLKWSLYWTGLLSVDLVVTGWNVSCETCSEQLNCFGLHICCLRRWGVNDPRFSSWCVQRCCFDKIERIDHCSYPRFGPDLVKGRFATSRVPEKDVGRPTANVHSCCHLRLLKSRNSDAHLRLFRNTQSLQRLAWHRHPPNIPETCKLLLPAKQCKFAKWHPNLSYMEHFLPSSKSSNWSKSG